MVTEPRTREQIAEDIRENLDGTIAKLTNFVPTSFNRLWTRAYAEQIYRSEVKALAAELAGTVDYAGKDDWDEDSLESELGVTNVDPELLNEYVDPSALDQLASNDGIVRDPGARATGTVTIETISEPVEIPEGYPVSTRPGSTANSYTFYVDADGDGKIDDTTGATVTIPSNETSTDVPVIADSVGNEYNVGSGSIDHLPTPEPGIEGVSQASAIDGGQDVESDESLRERLKTSLFTQSGGGTKKGVEGYIESNSSKSVRVELNENKDQDPPNVDVIVSGGDEAELKELIAEAKPYGLKYSLVRPTTIELSVDSVVTGSGVDTDNLESTVSNYMSDLGLGDPYRESALTGAFYTSEDDLGSVKTLDTFTTTIQNEKHQYDSGTNVYDLAFATIGRVDRRQFYVEPAQTDFELRYLPDSLSDVRVEAYVDDQWTVISESNLSLVDADSDGTAKTLRVDQAANVDEQTVIEVSYDHSTVSLDTVVDQSGDTYTVGDDVSLNDSDGDGQFDSISFSGSTPDDRENFYVDYTPNASVDNEFAVGESDKVIPPGEESELRVEGIDS